VEKTTRSFYNRIGRPLVYSAFALCILGILGYFLYLEIQPVKKVEGQSLSSIQATTPEPSDPVSTHERASHVVPATSPRYLTIDKLGISARILAMGITEDGALESPKTAWDVGWYNGSATPGAGGALLIDGHVNDTRNTLGVFGRLHALIKGDLIQIERGDGKLYTYRIVETEQIPVAQVNMAKLLKSISNDRQGLNIITCGGKYDPKGQTFTDRVIVYAEQV
jgi:sortase (surface protein transpeptidase)